MKQFDNSNLLSRVFERGELNAELTIRLATRIAEAHRSAEIIRENEFGSAATMREAIDIIKSNVEPFVGDVVPDDRWQSVTTFLYEFLSQHDWLFDMRVREGRIRECHGDLHLGNICIYEGEIELFDRIEFNDEFKNIDVLYDLAFLLMDLRYRKRNDLATLLLNTYAELTGDYAGVSMLPFYECVRALIRSEVALLLLHDETAEPATREKTRADALHYLEHACTYARRTRGRLIAVCGVSGSGKTTFARLLAQKGEYIHIRSDAIRKHLAGIDLHETDASLYTPESTEQTYRHLIETGVVLASRGHQVVLDAQFGNRRHRSTLMEKVRGFDLATVFVKCHASESTIRERLDNRTNDISDATSELVSRQHDSFEVFGEDEPHTRLDTNDATATTALISHLVKEWQ